MSEALDKLTTYALLGQFFDEELVKRGERPPKQTQLQFYRDGWRIYGGSDYQEPLAISVDRAYTIALAAVDADPQTVLDMTREHCGTLRLRVKSQRGREREETEAVLDKLRAGLERAREIKAKLAQGKVIP